MKGAFVRGHTGPKLDRRRRPGFVLENAAQEPSGAFRPGRLRPCHTVATDGPSVDGLKGITGLWNSVRSVKRLRTDRGGRRAEMPLYPGE